MFGRSGRKQYNILTVKIAIVKRLEEKGLNLLPSFLGRLCLQPWYQLNEAEKSAIKVTAIHPQGAMNVLTIFHGDPSNSC